MQYNSLPAHTPRSDTPNEIRAFTGIRGIAAVYVALYHFNLFYLFAGPARNVLMHGYLAVDLFFILSGFVMALTYRHLFAEGNSPRNTLVFLGKRIARIYPLYLVASVAAPIAYGGWAAAANISGRQAVSNLLLVQAWGIAGSFVGPGWSISTEWAAYLMFPLLCSVRLFRKRDILLTCVFLAFAVLFLIAELPAETTHVVRSRGPLDLYDGQNYGPVVRCLIEFGIGMVCFRVSRVRAVAAAMGRGWVSLALLLLIGGLLAVRDADIWVVPAVALLLISVAEDRNGVARFLGQPVFHWLGTISYSIYLFHTMVAAMVGPGIQRVVEATGVRGALGFEVLCLVAVVLATATLTYSLVERPGRRWVQGLFALRRRAGEGNPNLAAP